MFRMKDNFGFMPRDELKRLQERKLRHFITRQLYPFSPYYRRLFDENNIRPEDIRTVRDLERIPFLSKAYFVAPDGKGLKKRNLEFVLHPDEKTIKKFLPKTELLKLACLGLTRGAGYIRDHFEKEYRPIFLTATAGTTDQPVSFLYTNYDLENLRTYGRRIIDIFGISRDQKAVNLFPYAPHLAFWQTVFAGFSANIFILSTGGGKTLGTDGNIRSIVKVRPDFLIGVASYVYHVLKTAGEAGIDLSFLKSIALGASRVPEGFKKKVGTLLAGMGARGVKIMGTYGFTEARAAWAECPTDEDVSSGYHIYPDREIFEVIDPDTGEVRGEGEDGELVYTAIDARGSCVIRYRTGDLVKGGIVNSPCPHCGRTLPRISSDIARASNIKDVRVSKIKGAVVNLNALEQILDAREEIDEWQIEIGKKDNDPYEVDEMVLYVSLLREVARDEFTRHLNEDVFSATEVSFNRIEYVSREDILRRIEIESAVKAKKIVDRR